MKKTETLAKAIEVESRKIKREAAIREKDYIPTKVDDKLRNPNPSKRLEIFSVSHYVFPFQPPFPS